MLALRDGRLPALSLAMDPAQERQHTARPQK